MIGAKTMIWSGRCRLLAACAACMAVAVVTMSHSVWGAELPDAAALMLRLMARDNVPGAALALIKDGNIVLEHGYGFRDLAAAAPVTTATLFNIGSISKSFTALGVAQLVDRQGVELDAPVIRYIPDLRLSDPLASTLRRANCGRCSTPASSTGPCKPIPNPKTGSKASTRSWPSCRCLPSGLRG